jgi:nucleoside-diphosphate-sugar epimerase
VKTDVVTGGAGYVGSALVPKLLAAGYRIRVVDLFLYGDDVLAAHPALEIIKGDIRDRDVLTTASAGCDAFIHLACISNDPSFELDPHLGRSINYDAFRPMVEIARDAGVKRFIYASSSSVYGVKQEVNVTEELSLEPLTDYSKYKAMCEDVLREYEHPDFTTAILRPATICGYAPRQRLDVIVNIMTNLAVNSGRLTVNGGDQYRPNIHIDDMTEVYLRMLEWPRELIGGDTFNVGYKNQTVMELAETVRRVVGPERTELIQTGTNDPRSYRVSSDKIKKRLGFEVTHTIEDAVVDLRNAFAGGKLPNSLDDPRYYNVKLMKAIHLR